MEVFNALRRIKRQFGDEYNVVINDQDIYDWMYDAELDIIRATSDNDLTIPVAVKNFPLLIPDKVNVKRLSIGGKALTNISLSQVDLTNGTASRQGGVSYWYYQGGLVYLWPVSEGTATETIDVTYARVPAQMTVVASYLDFAPLQTGTTPVKFGLVADDPDIKSATNINLAMELSIDSITTDFYILTCGVDSYTAPNLHYSLMFAPSPSRFALRISNGTTIQIVTLMLKQDIIPGENFKLRVIYTSTTGTATMYKINLLTGQEVLQDTQILAPFLVQTTGPAPLIIGNVDQVSQWGTPAMKVRNIELRSNTTPSNAVLFLFDGLNDLGNLFGPVPSFVTSSGHTMTVTGPLLVSANNAFTVPEVFHEDIVKYCLAKAHTKNQNFRAAEAEMEQYDRRVSTRRNEAQAPETALYKIPDPYDYEE